MGLPKTKSLLTVEEYLTRERNSADRHLYVDGEIFLMAGESLAHGEISVNLVVSLGNQLTDSPCRVRTKDTKVRSGPEPKGRHATSGMYSYPDVVVICGEPEFHDGYQDVLLNPKVILEVLSPATEAFDQGGKFSRYQDWNPTLTDYLLVSQDRPEVVHYIRQGDGSWSYHRYKGLESSLFIESIHCTLQLAQVFHRVKFEEKAV